ncbi:hypothetical protein [Actinoallomurus acaciae]|uniref:Aminoglycoside phosphotransferase n=1 Tax=Actinoallomurus acaciae TaxID=502577 RepID=A0ABV5YL79_9ACTN
MNRAPTIDAALVRRLVRAQFPRWAGLPVRRVAHDGWDNRTFRLGDTMTVRLPSAEGHAAGRQGAHLAAEAGAAAAAAESPSLWPGGARRGIPVPLVRP